MGLLIHVMIQLYTFSAIFSASVFAASPFRSIENENGCPLIPQTATQLDNKIARIVDTKYGDGIIATNVYQAVRHGRCNNESPSICNWIFKYCGESSIFNQTVNDVFAIETEYYPGNFMYANIASAVYHYNPGDGLDVCTMNNEYKWMVFYADCVDRWYLYNLSYMDFLDASDLGLKTHPVQHSRPVSN